MGGVQQRNRKIGRASERRREKERKGERRRERKSERLEAGSNCCTRGRTRSDPDPESTVGGRPSEARTASCSILASARSLAPPSALR
eukprot:3098573-Rhodomonas_salina.1